LSWEEMIPADSSTVMTDFALGYPDS